jgi:hypothetical protein
MIAIAAAGLGVAGTLVIANAVNHANWSPWGVSFGWIVIVALATLLIKLRHSSGRGLGPNIAGSQWTTGPGDGMSAGDGGGS